MPMIGTFDVDGKAMMRLELAFIECLKAHDEINPTIPSPLVAIVLAQMFADKIKERSQQVVHDLVCSDCKHETESKPDIKVGVVDFDGPNPFDIQPGEWSAWGKGEDPAEHLGTPCK